MSDINPTRRRVALYVRVSTARQADGELSIPDQIKQGQDYCAARSLQLVETFVEPGASATDDRRPEFQKMIDAATSAAHPFDVIVVHSISQFFREQFLSEMYLRKLRKAGVGLLSMTQEFNDDTTGNLIRQILGSFDEYQSRENAKHTLRAMQENARQGFWNGSQPPFGYRAIAAEKRGTKVKKVLAIDDGEAAVVRRILRPGPWPRRDAARHQGNRQPDERRWRPKPWQAVPHLQRASDSDVRDIYRLPPVQSV